METLNDHAMVEGAAKHALEVAPKSPEMQKDWRKKMQPLKREQFCRGELDCNEGDMDNGDDSDLHASLAAAEKMRNSHPDLGESSEVTSDVGESAGAKFHHDPKEMGDEPAPAQPAAGDTVPALPVISATDEQYMPAIMDKLVTMRNEMATLKGANWEEILESHRDGVVQIMVVKKKFLWKAAYRSAMSEQISGSGWFIKNEEFDGKSSVSLLKEPLP